MTVGTKGLRADSLHMQSGMAVLPVPVFFSKLSGSLIAHRRSPLGWAGCWKSGSQWEVLRMVDV